MKHRAASRTLPLRFVIHVALALSRALSVLHSLSLVHRDVKSGNILLGNDSWQPGTGQPLPRVVLADFGFAVPLEWTSNHNCPMSKGFKTFNTVFPLDTSVGTIPWMAPEALRHSNPGCRKFYGKVSSYVAKCYPCHNFHFHFLSLFFMLLSHWAQFCFSPFPFH